MQELLNFLSRKRLSFKITGRDSNDGAELFYHVQDRDGAAMFIIKEFYMPNYPSQYSIGDMDSGVHVQAEELTLNEVVRLIEARMHELSL